MNKSLACAAVTAALGLSAPLCSADQGANELAELKQMIGQMKQDYETRIHELEQRVAKAESKAASAQQAADGADAKVSKIEQESENQPQSGDSRFNPAISLVLQGGLSSYSRDPEDFHMEGLPLGGEAGLHPEGLALWETELTASANIDHLFYGQATIGLHQDDNAIEVDIEEAFADTLALPAGLGVRFGRFYSDIGYLNSRHTHVWDFADAPLAYQAFLGGQYRDDGVRGTWLAPIDSLFVELGVEWLRGGAYPGGGGGSDLGAVTNGFLHVGGDAGQDSSWQIGFSRMNIDVHDRQSGGHAHGDEASGPSFSGDSTLSALDAVWKTSFSGGRQLILQGEYLFRDEDGAVTLNEAQGDALFGYSGEQSGWYVQSVYQFLPRWRAGLRYDRVSADNTLRMQSNATGEADDDIFDESGFASNDHDPQRWTAMLDWSPSEFSRLRLQYARDPSRARTDEQIMLQYIMALGAHGAHQY
jgi:hypothetical protein